MINELYLLKLNPENASSKQKIISILSQEWPLTAKQVFERCQKEYGSAISYQGVHKVVRELEENKVIERAKNGYQLNVEWIQNSKKALEDVEKRYAKQKKILLPKNFSGSIELEFDSMTDFCVSATELYISGQLSRGSNGDTLYGNLEYGWFPLKFRFEHFGLLYKMVLNNPKTYCLIRKKTPFGEYIVREYNRVGINCVQGNDEFAVNEDIGLQGDYIIEVRFDDETKKIIEKCYTKWKNVEDAFKEFGLNDEPKVHVTMRITKNPELASVLRTQFEKVFEGKK